MKVIHLGRADYVPTWRAMQAFAARPFGMEGEELWLCEHPPVFTLGMAGRPEHVLAAGGIDVVQTDRGGQATYHGPGQVVAYPLINLGERPYFVKEYVHRLEEAVIRTLGEWGLPGHRVAGARRSPTSRAWPKSARWASKSAASTPTTVWR